MLSAHESVVEEVAAALTVTGESAATLVHLAGRLATDLPGTRQALEAGHLDLPKARVICDLSDRLPDGVAQRLEEAVLDRAPTQTTGQLRRRAKRIATKLAPQQVEDRKQDSIRKRRLELWETPAGTADLALTNLAPEDAHAIFNKITAAAHALRADGDDRPLHLIRADLATELLHGAPLPDAITTLLTQAAQPPAPTQTPSTADTDGAAHSTDPGGAAGPDGSPAAIEAAERGEVTAAGGRRGVAEAAIGAAGRRGVTTATETTQMGDAVRATTTDSADGAATTATAATSTTGATTDTTAATGGDATKTGGVGGAGDAALVRTLATIVDQQLTAVADKARAAGRLEVLAVLVGRAVQNMHDQLAPFRDTWCQATGSGPDGHGHPGYRPPAAMRRLIEARHPTCVFPTCNRRSDRCDLDHTTAYGAGITCRCNLAPLCRRHHRTKQSPGWKLLQIWPGLLVWITPSGTWHITLPNRE